MGRPKKNTTDTTTTTETVKRGPGRPRKTEECCIFPTGKVVTHAVVAVPQTPRKRGRPRKDAQIIAEGVICVKDNATTVTAPRKRGRPKKTECFIIEGTTAPKRRGRPPKATAQQEDVYTALQATAKKKTIVLKYVTPEKAERAKKFFESLGGDVSYDYSSSGWKADYNNGITAYFPHRKTIHVEATKHTITSLRRAMKSESVGLSHRQKLVEIYCKHNANLSPTTFDCLAPKTAKIVDGIERYITKIEAEQKKRYEQLENRFKKIQELSQTPGTDK